MTHSKKQTGEDQQEASALIVAIGILFIMFLLASVLATLSSTGSVNAVTYSDQVQARMLARSGVEHALGSEVGLLEAARSYRGEDWNGDGELTGVSGPVISRGVGGASGSEDENGNQNGRLDRKAADPKFALHPSFAVKTPDGRPRLLAIKQGTRTVYRGFSGRVPSSYGNGTDTYSVKVRAVQGINVNSLNPHVGQMINRLCGQLDGCNEDQQPGYNVVGPYPDVRVRREDRDEDGHEERVLETQDGGRPDVIYDPREEELRGGYGTVQELKGELGGNFEVLEEWLVQEDQVFLDSSVIRPKPQNTDRTFDESGDCPEDAAPYDPCRIDGGGELDDAYPLPDNVPGQPKAIRGRIDDGDDSSLETHTDLIGWVNNAGGTSPGALPESLSQDDENRPYGAFRYNFNYSRQPRAPVNLNSVREEMMIALMEGVRARVLEVTQKEVTEPGGTTGLPYIEYRYFNPMYQTRMIPKPEGPRSREEGGLAEEAAEEIVEEIMEYRQGETTISFRGSDQYTGPFQTWPEFEAFIDQRVVQELGYSNDIGHLLKAHFNPNTRFGKFNGNTNARWTWISDGKDCSSPPCEWQGNRVSIDKTDFLYHTTEFTLQKPTHYVVSSHGRVVGDNQELVAQASVRSVVRTHRMARHTTQADFEINKKEAVSDTFNVTSYPENVMNVNEVEPGGEAAREIIENRENTGSGLGGQMALRTKTDYNDFTESRTYTEWSYDQPDESARGRWDSEDDPLEFTVNRENNPHYPMPFMSREYNDVSDDQTDENFGLVGGKWAPEETENYPRAEEGTGTAGLAGSTSDPYNYADLAPDGMIMTSDRYRSQRYLTTHSGTPANNAPDVVPTDLAHQNDNWNEGHVEFWWKPRAGTVPAQGAGGTGSADNPGEKIIYPMWSSWVMNRGTPRRGEDSWMHGFLGPHRTRTGEEQAFHRATWKENYAWRLGDTAGKVDPVQGSVGPGVKRWDDGTGTEPLINRDGDPQNVGTPSANQRIARPPVKEAQRWAGYECGNMSWDRHSDRWQDGAGTIARLNPSNGCLTAYPGIQYINFTQQGLGGKPNFHDRGDGRAFDTFPESNPRLSSNPHPNMDWNKYTDYFSDTDGRMISSRTMGGHYWRSYYVKEPSDSQRSSKWVFKWSLEHFMDMDTGLGPERSPDATTAGRHYWVDMDNWDATGASGGGGTYRNFTTFGPETLTEGKVVATIDLDELSEEDRRRATPKPGKWNHITLEFDAESIYAFRDGDVGPGTSYPLYVPWDFWHTFTDGGRNVPEGEIADDGEGNAGNWLPIAAVPRVPDENVQLWSTKPGQFDIRDNLRENNTEFIVPQINVNGVEKTNTDLYAGNYNPITGRFQPGPFMYAEHVVWTGGDPEEDSPGEMENQERATAWYYMKHFTLKHYGNLAQFGSNFARRTKHYGQFGDAGSQLDQKAWGNWARFYDDGFIEGTVDELIWTNDNNIDEPEEGGPPYETGRYKEVATYQGRFHRAAEHDHGEESYWEPDEDELHEKFNYYAEDDQRVLGGGNERELRVVSVSHTQYRPASRYYQRDYHMDGRLADEPEHRVPPSERPRWEVQVKTESGSWKTNNFDDTEAAPDGHWLGTPVSPEELNGEELVLDGEEDLEYRLNFVDPANRSKLNTTPFFEDITVLYRRDGSSQIKSLKFYTP